ncbi:MAG: cyclic nucleotide-binding domain-containing protein [Desulfobacterales bacterium]|jgi:CRP-like cAMP-binding protein|nr:cyclic nucleotide-binding domain-containing protein [Desulfobacterales bacterium]
MSSLGKNSPEVPCEFKENLDLLRQTYLFSGFPLESLKVFAYLGTREKLHDGDYLFRQGEDDDQAYCIVSGKARLELGDNGPVRLIREVGPGDFIGGLALLGDARRLYSLRAIGEMVCIVLKREKFSKAVQQFPDQMPRIFRAVVEAVIDWEGRFLVALGADCGGCLPRLGVSLL